MIKYCDGSKKQVKCPHPSDCTINCQYNDVAPIKPFHSKKLVQDLPTIHWEGIQTQLIRATWAFVIVIVLSLVGCVSYIVGRLI